VAYRGERPEYFCRTKGCVRITQADVDTIAEQVMVAYLARPEVIDTLRAGEQHDDRELSAIRDQLATVRADMTNSPTPLRPELSASCWPHDQNPPCSPRSNASRHARKTSLLPAPCAA
jgi:hypothetical protein